MNPDTAREEAVDTFIDTILGGGDTRFVRSFLGLAGYVNRLGMFNSLSQTLLKITSPGIPDFYQGSELWDLSLVDPDNRRPVDFAKRVKILHQLQIKEQQLGLSALGADLLTRMEDGSIKLFLTWKALTFRRNNLDIFEQGSYTPLAVKGEQAESVIVFARTIEEKMVLVIVPRFLSRVIRDDVSPPLGRAAWGDTLIELPEDASGINYRNIFTGEPHKGKTADRTLFLGDILQQFPVALLELAIQGEYS
jgi:(1->4)-alpha-D-glucan 1-alpha-D-glucosylmutase